MNKPKRKIQHQFVGEHKRGAHCRERVIHVIDGIRMWFACGWPRSAHPTIRTFTIDQAWSVALRPGGSASVVDMLGGGYAVPVERSREISPPSQTTPIRAILPDGAAWILPGWFTARWRVVRRVVINARSYRVTRYLPSALIHCQGCDSDQPDVNPYRVTFHDGQSERVRYCGACAELASMDWSGETEKIEPLTGAIGAKEQEL